eukprot:comp21683_c0_seq1/m.30541 comp21683_c0_seq1/g.30541  ORF comp21683_c0_seq1/g.30541 comp21683_c0_seq1/m.30541 type:complete len:186 (-) comp21683_c0_seq1:562-1119(-)
MADDAGPPRCSCGFYGSAQFDNLCSKCYQAKHKSSSMDMKSTPPPIVSTPTPTPAPAPAPTPITATSSPRPIASSGPLPIPNSGFKVGSVGGSPGSLLSDVGSAPGSTSGSPAPKNRCAECRAKLTMVQCATNKCKCGNVFCDKHRLEHPCGFDYKTTGREKIEKDYKKARDTKAGGRTFHRMDS